MTDKISPKVYIKVKDHSVSKETFELVYNDTLDLLETFPQPDSQQLPSYYNSADYISHTDAKRNLFEKAYHFVKGIALNRKLKLINSVSQHGKSLLDVGCGTGDFLYVASKSGWKISGVEPNKRARTVANSKTNNAILDVDQLSKWDDGSFDVITLWHVLEHLPNVEEHFEMFKRLLKPTGTLIIAVPNYKSYDAAYYKEFWAAYDVPRHLWHFSQKSLNCYASIFEMRIEKILPMKFDAFYVSLLSEKYKTGKMNFLSGFINGLRSNYKARRSGEFSSLIYVLKKQNNRLESI